MYPAFSLIRIKLNILTISKTKIFIVQDASDFMLHTTLLMCLNFVRKKDGEYKRPKIGAFFMAYIFSH